MQYDDASLLQLLIRYCWPFWMFKDASRGDRFARAAAYRDNRMKRVYLPGYLVKWVYICCVALGLVHAFEVLASEAEEMKDVLVWVTAGWGMVFAFGVCVLTTITYVFFYLSRNE